MSLTHSPKRNFWNDTKLSWTVCNGVKLYLSLLKCQERSTRGCSCSHFPVMEAQTDSSSSFQPFESLGPIEAMLGNPLQRSHTCSNDCIVRAAPNGSNVFVALGPAIRMYLPWLEIMIHRCVRRRLRCKSMQFTALQDEPTQSGMNTTPGCLPSPLSAGEPSTNP